MGNGLRVAVGAWLGDVGAVDFHSVAGAFALANGATVVRVARSAFTSLTKRDKNWAGVNGAYVPVLCLANAVSPVAVKRPVGNGILKLEVNSPEGE